MLRIFECLFDVFLSINWIHTACGNKYLRSHGNACSSFASAPALINNNGHRFVLMILFIATFSNKYLLSSYLNKYILVSLIEIWMLSLICSCLFYSCDIEGLKSYPHFINKLSTSKSWLSSCSSSLRLPFLSFTCAFVLKSVKPCCVFVLECKGHLFRLGFLYSAIARLAARSRVMPRLGGGKWAGGASATNIMQANPQPPAHSNGMAFVVLFFSRLEVEN